MLILVSTRIAENDGYPERRDALSHDWGRFLEGFGLVPILVPNSLKDISPYMKLGAKGLLLTGGDSLGSPARPTDRDKIETQLIGGAIESGMPILGVCRGLQMLNRYFGGDSISVDGHVGRHQVRLCSGDNIEVNSFHNEAVIRDGLAESLHPFAFASDGVVEGVKHPNLPITAFQWHPERTSPSAACDQVLLDEWMTACA